VCRCALVAVSAPLRRWLSTNTLTLELSTTQRAQQVGISYRGSKSTSFNGIECLHWGEVFSRCSDGFEELVLENPYVERYWYEFGPGTRQAQNSAFLSYMSPDQLGVLESMTPPGPFDSEMGGTRGHNECRM